MISALSQVILLLQSLPNPLVASMVPAPVPPSNLALTPPMGFNNWARYECNLNQTLFTETADLMVAKGLLKAGYRTITVDDCWMQTRRDPQTQQLLTNTTLFPMGMAWLGQYFHERGFLFGIYQDAGYQTCGGYPGSLGHYETDVNQFASWQVDYIKLDGCYINRNNSLPISKTLEPTFRQLYDRFGQAIRAQSRPMVYSESAPAYFAGLSAGTGDRVGEDWYKVHSWIGNYGQLWRHSTDISVYKDNGESRWNSVMTNYRFNLRLARVQKPGNWNDPDFLITGDDVGLTMDEQKAQFGLWVIMASPLILSTSIKDLSEDQVRFLTNEEIIAVNQDPLGLQGRPVWTSPQSDVLVKPLSDQSRAVAVLNKGDQREAGVGGGGGFSGGPGRTANISIPFSNLGYNTPGCKYRVRELFSRTEQDMTIDTNLGAHHTFINTTLPPHGVALYRITSISDSKECSKDTGILATPTGNIFLTSSLLCLDVFKSVYANNTQVLAFPCTGNENQIWTLRSDGTIGTQDHSMCLDTMLTDASNMDGSFGQKVVINACDPTNVKTQQWTYNQHDGSLVQTYSGFCLDGPGISQDPTDNLVNLRVWKCSKFKDSQVWSMPL